jgi:hypothetical protein
MERKVKYDYAFKLECVKLVLENIIHVLCFKSKGPNESNIRKWVEFIVNMRQFFQEKNYSVNFKLKVCKAIEKT